MSICLYLLLLWCSLCFSFLFLDYLFVSRAFWGGPSPGMATLSTLPRLLPWQQCRCSGQWCFLTSFFRTLLWKHLWENLSTVGEGGSRWGGDHRVLWDHHSLQHLSTVQLQQPEPPGWEGGGADSVINGCRKILWINQRLAVQTPFWDQSARQPLTSSCCTQWAAPCALLTVQDSSCLRNLCIQTD